ncbi:hypothetical protein QBC47DRAFT_393691 [Echria macrotheca]|uniref:Uncharacterized protein n=1 Tax=Echria macrotheca TaxID=438768 RepID=A0AAJ0B2M3_9PEZI|nr:hypothetical protein QBC47DRAFT_393691 [Echria macrotheca]
MASSDVDYAALDAEFSDFDDFGPEWVDEDATYKAIPEDLKTGTPRSELAFYDVSAKHQDGAVRSEYKGGATGRVIYDKDKADYDLTVERLVWIDGWQETTGEGDNKQHHQEMTLVVLKFVFETKTKDSKVSYALAELRFKSDDEDGKDPEVVAWGPFRRRETWNVSAAQRRVLNKADAGLKAGMGGPDVTVGLAREDETSWERIDFDCGSSKDLFNLKKDNPMPNGVMWKVQSNRLHKQGVTPELRIGVLLKRPVPGPYRVDFRLTAHTGTISKIRDKVSTNILGISGGSSVVWRATPNPGNTDNCYGDGLAIVGAIDINNLGKLIVDTNDGTNLKAEWLNPWDRFKIPTPEAKSETQSKVEIKAESKTSEQEGFVRLAATSTTTAKQTTNVEVPVVPATAPHLTAGGPLVTAISYDRLLSLEARAAQAEARIAAHDQIIFQLQQALAKLEQ